jgi:hypothetical protein
VGLSRKPPSLAADGWARPWIGCGIGVAWGLSGPLPAAFYGWLAGLLLGYALLTTGMKRFYTRRFGWQ